MQLVHPGAIMCLLQEVILPRGVNTFNLPHETNTSTYHMKYAIRGLLGMKGSLAKTRDRSRHAQLHGHWSERALGIPSLSRHGVGDVLCRKH